MVSRIFKGMKDIRYSVGLKLTSDFGNHGTHDVLAIFVRFLIGYFKGNDIIYGRKGDRSLIMKGVKIVIYYQQMETIHILVQH